ncbi:MAG TPA: radical SAM protein [Herpetosiphon sp.]|uniref:Radical SAM domain protein n=1 Tax=Herpetosiphon aurantiacus (strain ATCC 23779 / DSM 785 / 114-95) TaxID=316274 RepID=A9B7V5_HERA2|nr:STM4011 family radical SAM protein [Herpetosiphon sp.]ABX04483.1 radical SAM domain protein [Herpetosiphon aurantiacus DSM 785]HBW52264.1 radical SAM protein [Herpetosiphon sp.]
MKLAILYRGPLSSCNYGCSYCPFAKHQETAAEHAHDEAALQRFVAWVAQQIQLELSIFFTPWGEALIRRRYQRAIVELANLPHVQKVAIQTNLSARLDWAEDCPKQRLGLWATYHPTQTPRERFLARCHEAITRGIPISVGVVGMHEHQAEIAALRKALPKQIYLWINAYKREVGYYSPEEITQLTAIDPLFPINNTRHPSEGRACATGESVISVDGDGTMRRCHFVREPIGNIYNVDWQTALQPRVCANATCGCHIGYIHMPHLGLQQVFGQGMLERIPQIPLEALG